MVKMTKEEIQAAVHDAYYKDKYAFKESTSYSWNQYYTERIKM